MKLRWIAMAMVMTAGVLATSLPARAQGLNDVLTRLLSNNCGSIGGPTNAPLGPGLQNVCNFPTTDGASSATGSVGSESRAGGAGQLEIYRRLRQRQGQGQGAASADSDGARGLGVFVSADYQNYDQDSNRFEGGFSRDTVGGTAGVDYMFSNGFVIGTALNYAHEFGNYDGVGGGFDHNAYGIQLYGSVVPIPRLFIDTVLGYTRKEYGFERRASVTLAPNSRIVAGSTTGDTDGNEFRISLNTGYDFQLGMFTFGPRAGVSYRETTMDSFREQGNTGLELSYDNQNAQSLTTTAGIYGAMAISTGFGVIVPQGTFEYVHEFLDDQRSVGFRLVQEVAQQRFLFQTDRPDRDYFNLSVGASMVLPSGLQPFLNFRELIAYRDRSSHTVTVGLRIPF